METTMNKINNFVGEYYFLSNFYECNITYGNIDYEHSEGAFQAQKTLDTKIRQMSTALTPSESKKAFGRKGLKGFPKFILRKDWEEVKDNIMYEILKQKFTQNPELKDKLLSTGDAELIEGNLWHDNYWGDCSCPKCKCITGKNQLGKTLMKLREELKTE